MNMLSLTIDLNNKDVYFIAVCADLPNSLETAPCCVSMCWARSYPRSPNRDSSSRRCCETNALSVDGDGPPGKRAADDTEPGVGRFGDIPTKKEKSHFNKIK